MANDHMLVTNTPKNLVVAKNLDEGDERRVQAHTPTRIKVATGADSPDPRTRDYFTLGDGQWYRAVVGDTGIWFWTDEAGGDHQISLGPTPA